MKSPKLLKIVKRFLSADEEKQHKHIECFTDVLKKLKKKERILKKKLENESNNKNRQQIKKDLAIIYAQRTKGIRTVKILKKKC
ncbi:MAG: hypothetical protein KZQ83_11155 [gamma proteobacterium symbiont of Taylorina sp.]|nr:hypothetical protein [gamma proteobacterium symbiont of Taylorina sp.]